MEKNKTYLDIAKFLSNLEKQAYKKVKKQKIDVSDKSAHDLLTNYDLNIEKIVIATLNKHFPQVKIVSEEFNTSVKAEGTYFVIDPIDGTINFGNKIYDRFAVQIAYVENNELVCGAIYMPEVAAYYAAKGFGAFKNNKKFVRDEKDIAHSLLTVDCEIDENAKVIKALKPFIMNDRRTGAACVDNIFTAEGKFGIYVYTKPKVWDILPGEIIALEAGCVKGDFKNLHIVANNQQVLDETIKLLKKEFK